MFNRLFAGRHRGRKPSHIQRCRLTVEQLEDRLVPSTATPLPAVTGLQSQALANPTIDATGATLQYIAPGSYQTVAAEAVTIGAGQTGQVDLSFQAQTWSGVPNRVGVRYLIDSQLDPNDAVVRNGTAADVIEDVGTDGWQTLYLTRLLNLAAGTHTIAVQVFCLAAGDTAPDSLAVYSPTLSLVAFNTVDGVPAANGVQVESLTSPIGGNSNVQDVTATNTWQTVTSTSVTVGATKTGLYDLAFQAEAAVSLSTRVSVRYLIDGNPDPLDQALGANGPGVNVTEDYADGEGNGQWHTLFLTHQLVLGAGTHTISIQIMDTPIDTSGADLAVYTPVLSLVGYNTIDGQHAADGLQSQAVTSPVGGAPGQQDLTAGSWQTVASQSVTVAGIRSGLYAFAFQAQAESSYTNRVYVRYLIDGQPDPTDLAITQSASEADAVEDYFSNFGADTLHTLSLSRLLSLTPGTHTISVQVYCTMNGTDGPDLAVYTPVLQLTGFNNITPTGSTGTGGTGSTGNNSTFNYNPTTQVLTINGTAANDVFKFSQATQANADGSLTTKYTFTLNNASASYTSAQLSEVIVNGNGGSDSATLTTNDTYVGLDGKTHEVPEQVQLGPGGGVLQLFNAQGNPYTFLQLVHFANIHATMGEADSAFFTDSPGNDTFVSSGSTSYMSGTGYYNYVSGAGSVTATSTTGHDIAYFYDGTGASTFTANGATSSTMTGTDHGLAFSNTALGFKFNYGIARHAGDVANLNTGPGNEVFVGLATLSYLYSYTGSVETMLDQASGFSHVNAVATTGSNDDAFDYAPSVNSVTGFKHLVT